MFDWNDLKYFLAVAQHGSTLSAAKSLRVNQSTVGFRSLKDSLVDPAVRTEQSNEARRD